MKSKELLFELIRSLTKSEKRYFTVFTSIHKESNNYVKLFNAIHTQKKYDEEALLKQFKSEDFIKQFSVAKNYLMNLILKSLSNYHQKAKKSIELNECLSEIEILYWKGLYKLSNKKINQAKKIAEQYDLTHYLLLINFWERKNEDYVSKKMINEDVIKETHIYLNRYNQQMQLNFLIKKMESITKSSIKSTEENVQLILELFKNELMQLKEDEIESFHAKVAYLLLKGVGYTILREGKKEFYYKKRLLDFLEENPHQIKENPIRYASSLNNILLYYYFRGYTKEYPVYLDKLDQVELKFDHVKDSFLDTQYNLKIGYYLHLRDPNKIKEILNEMEIWYNKDGTRKSIQSKMICEYNMALAYFFLKDKKQCLKWCNSSFKMFDMKTKKFRHDLAISTLVVQTLIYFELKHFGLALRSIELVFTIAIINNYDKVELSIFKLLKDMVIAENSIHFSDRMKKLIKEQGVLVINLDKDVIVFWLESNGY